MSDLAFLSIDEASRRLRTRELSPVDLTEAMLRRIERLNPLCDAFIMITGDIAMEEARKAEREIAVGRYRGPMHGIPYALKDIIDVAGLATTCHSKILLDNIAKQDAGVLIRLREAGGILTGKLALHEFATGGPAFDLPFPPARNPWNPALHPGGSSSGSGAALAAGLTFASVGTDTAGSIRNPATCCGIVGLKPTYGLVSRAGAYSLSFSLDHVGPMARSVKDCAILLGAVAGHDPADPSSVTHAVPDYRAGIEDGIRGLRIGVIEHFYGDDASADEDIAVSLSQAAATLCELGAQVEPVRLPPLSQFGQCGRVIQQADSYAIHRRWLQERPEDYCELSLAKLSAGAFLSAADYVEALQVRRVLCTTFDQVISGYDALITASGLAQPTRLDDPVETARSYERHARMPFNVTGTPAIAVPTGFSKSGLPFGMQIAGRAFDEATLLRVAYAFEQAIGWGEMHPPLFNNQSIAAA